MSVPDTLSATDATEGLDGTARTRVGEVQRARLLAAAVEAVDRFYFDARWKHAVGWLGFDYPGFVHTVLVDMRGRLQASERPDRIFEVVLETAKRAGLVGRRPGAGLDVGL